MIFNDNPTNSHGLSCTPFDIKIPGYVQWIIGIIRIQVQLVYAFGCTDENEVDSTDDKLRGVIFTFVTFKRVMVQGVR